MAIIQQQFLKYLVVGGINTVFTGVVFFLLLRVFFIHYLLALVLASLAGICLTYVLNYLWVFQPERQLRFRARFVKYTIIYIVSISLNLLLLKGLVTLLNSDPFYAQLALIPVIVAFNFFAIRCWSLRRYL